MTSKLKKLQKKILKLKKFKTKIRWTIEKILKIYLNIKAYYLLINIFSCILLVVIIIIL